MRLSVRPMGAEDVDRCVALVASHPEERRRYGTLLNQLPSAWLKLLRTGSLKAIFIQDTEARTPRVVGCGVSVFITDRFLHRLKTPPLVWLGPELVSQTLASDDSILSPKEIREANSREGLNLVVWAGVVRPSRPEDRDALGLELMGAYHYEHMGYRLKEFVTQPAELEWSRMVLNGGSFLWQPSEGCYRDGRSLPLEELAQGSFLLGASRDLAYEALGARFSPLFCYVPPTIYFRPAEQRLLLAALRGLTDEQLGEELGISFSAVKKTWRSVYDRASVVLFHQLPVDGTDTETKRGKEKRHPLLEYLRKHIEELRPVLPPRVRKFARRPRADKC